MFDGYDDSQELHSNQFFVPPLRDEVTEDPRHWVTLIETGDYGLEVLMSGFVSVERETLEAEAFLANLYEHG